MANHWLEIPVLYKANSEVQHLWSHFMFVLPWNCIWKKLYPRFGDRSYDLADSKVTIRPKVTKVRTPWDTKSLGESWAARLIVNKTFAYLLAVFRGPSHILAQISFVNAHNFSLSWRGFSFSCVWFHLDCKHEQLVVENWYVNQALRVWSLACSLKRSETGFTVFFFVVEKGVDDFVSVAKLDRFAHDFCIVVHSFEDVCLQVAIHHKYWNARDVLKCFLVGLNYLLYCIEWSMRNEHLLDVLIYHFDFFYVNALRRVSTNRA